MGTFDLAEEFWRGCAEFETKPDDESYRLVKQVLLSIAW